MNDIKKPVAAQPGSPGVRRRCSRESRFRAGPGARAAVRTRAR